MDEIQQSRNWLRAWHERSERIVMRYTDEQSRQGAGFNVLWPNTEILRAAVYGNRPRPDVRRRGNKTDPMGRTAAQVIEKSIEFMWDSQSEAADGQVDAMLTDHMLAGAGILRVRYTPQFVRRRDPLMEQPGEKGATALYFSTMLDEVDEADVQHDEQGDAYQELTELMFERADIEHVYYRDFLWSPCRAWRDARWCAFRHEFTADELREAFGQAKADRCNLTTKGTNEMAEAIPRFFKTAEVWEIWDKEDRKVLFVSNGHAEGPLAEYDDEYGLRDFLPTVGPFASVPRTDSTMPIPEFTLYQDQAAELDDLTARIQGLMDHIKVAGFYDASVDGIQDVLKGGNRLIPIDNWQALVERGGIDGAVSWVPIAQAVTALQVLYQQRQVVLDTIYQIIGLSDIARGSSDPRETATAQQIKGQFGSLRLRPRQQGLQAYLRDTMRLQAELIAEKFEPTTLMQMTGMQIPEPALMLLRLDALRRFSVDIETDSTIAADEQANKQSAIEFMGALAQFAQALAPLVEGGVVTPEAGRVIMMNGARRFRMGREVEEALEQPGQPAQPEQEQPDPVAMAKAEIDGQNAETKRLQVVTSAANDRQKLAIEAEKVGLSEREMEANRMMDVLDRVRGGDSAA